MWGEIALAALSLVTGLVAWLRGGNKDAKKDLKRLEGEAETWKNRALNAADYVEELERKYLELKKSYGETLTDDELRMLARGVRVDSKPNGEH